MLGEGVNRKVDLCKRWIDVSISKTCERVSRPANKLYPIENKENKKIGRQKLRALVKPWIFEIANKKKRLLLETLRDVLLQGSVKFSLLSSSVMEKFINYTFDHIFLPELLGRLQSIQSGLADSQIDNKIKKY